MLAVDLGGRVLAHYAAVAMQFRFGREQVRAGQIVDAYSRTEVRGTRVFSSCYERFIEAFGTPAGLPLMFGFPGRKHYEMGLKALKYVPIGSVPYWVRESRWRAVVRGQAFRDQARLRCACRGRPVAACVPALRCGRRARLELVCAPLRTGGRRWSTHTSRRGETAGRRPGRSCAPTRGTLRWAELVWDGESAGALVAIDRALVRLARRHSCTNLELWFGGDPAAERTLGRVGWARHPCPQDVLLVARTFDTRVDLDRMQRGLYLTMGDADLV